MSKTILAVALLLLPARAALAEEKTEDQKKIEVGKPAPDFTLKDEKEKQVKLSSFKGKKNVLLAFYPRDFTGGCTAELKGFRDEHELFTKSEVQVLGISTDPVESHQRFCDSLKLPFPLLADEGGKVSKLYGILIKRDKDLLSGRSVFLIDKEGVVRHADADYQLKGDDHDLLIKAVKEIGGKKEGEKATSAGPPLFRIEGLAFGRITVNGEAYEKDVILDGKAVRARKKGPSKGEREKYGHTPLTLKESIPWDCKVLVIGMGMDGKLPVAEEVKEEAKRRGVELVLLKTPDAVAYLKERHAPGVNAILHVTC